jgi:hypothetical protein
MDIRVVFQGLLILVTFFFLVYLVYDYNNKHCKINKETFEPLDFAELTQEETIDLQEDPKPVMSNHVAQPKPLPMNKKNNFPKDCFPKDKLTADDLLPKDAANSQWAQVNPAGQGDVKNQNYLTAGYHMGINSIGSTLRNPNMQIRSEPPNPQMKVSPWMQTTIEPDLNRKPLEINGCE